MYLITIQENYHGLRLCELEAELNVVNSANFALRRENEMLTDTLKLQRTMLEQMDALDARPLRTIIAERVTRNLLATKISGLCSQGSARPGEAG